MIRHVTNTLSYGLTLGMANILQSKKILLLVSGQEKRYVLSRLLSEEVSTEFPASLLWLHNDVTCVYDHDAYVEPI
jgi:galactosamine-6-phosphate isomerase